MNTNFSSMSARIASATTEELLAIEDASDSLASMPKDMRPDLQFDIASADALADKQDIGNLIISLVEIGRPAIPLLEDIAKKEENPKVLALVERCLQRIR